MVGVEQWAEVRRMKRVEGLSAREISRRTGLARDTVSRLLMAEAPPRYARARAESILDPFKDWVCEQLQADPKVPSQRLRELAVEIGYAGGKTIFDAYVREVRPRFLVSAHSSGRSIAQRSWSSAICGSQASTSRLAMGRPVVGGSSRRSRAGRGRSPAPSSSARRRRTSSLGSRARCRGWVCARRSWSGTASQRSLGVASRATRSWPFVASWRSAGSFLMLVMLRRRDSSSVSIGFLARTSSRAGSSRTTWTSRTSSTGGLRR